MSDRHFDMVHFNDVRVIPSTEGNVCKYVFTADSGVGEAVLYRLSVLKSRLSDCSFRFTRRQTCDVIT